jgi:hypothetical protein
MLKIYSRTAFFKLHYVQAFSSARFLPGPFRPQFQRPKTFFTYLTDQQENLILCCMALGSTQPLTEMGTRNISWG